jgi:monovalent cation/hydrogen antiporter
MSLRTSEITCEHLPADPAGPRAETCEACGSTFNLRACATCGYVGCCESQQGHDRAHAFGESHPVIRSMSISSHSFTWCYECEAYV